MKLAITADLHLGHTPKRLIKDMIGEMAALSPQAVVIAGDIGECLYSVKYFKECIELFTSELKIPCLVIPGNHDLWTQSEISSLELFNTVLPKITRDAGAFWLEDENYILDGVAVVGSYLHYDYSAKDSVGACAGFTDEYYAKYKGTINNDAHYMHGMPSDIEFAGKLGQKFCERLQSAQNNADVKHIIVATHVSCLEEQMCRHPQDFNWSRGTPYFGNLSWRKNILGAGKVRCVVSGHSHRGRKEEIAVGNRVINVINLDSDYKNPKYILIEVD